MAKLQNKKKDNPKLEQRHRKTVTYRCIWNITSVALKRRLLINLSHLIYSLIQFFKFSYDFPKGGGCPHHHIHHSVFIIGFPTVAGLPYYGNNLQGWSSQCVVIKSLRPMNFLLCSITEL